MIGPTWLKACRLFCIRYNSSLDFVITSKFHEGNIAIYVSVISLFFMSLGVGQSHGTHFVVWALKDSGGGGLTSSPVWPYGGMGIWVWPVTSSMVYGVTSYLTGMGWPTCSLVWGWLTCSPFMTNQVIGMGMGPARQLPATPGILSVWFMRVSIYK